MPEEVPNSQVLVSNADMAEHSNQFPQSAAKALKSDMVIDNQQISRSKSPSQVAYDGDQNYIDSTPLLSKTKEVINLDQQQFSSKESAPSAPVQEHASVLTAIIEVQRKFH